jgi:hypothetical protein
MRASMGRRGQMMEKELEVRKVRFGARSKGERKRRRQDKTRFSPEARTLRWALARPSGHPISGSGGGYEGFASSALPAPQFSLWCSSFRLVNP